MPGPGGGGSQPSGQATSTTVQKADPWQGLQPYLTGGLTRGQGGPTAPGLYPEAQRLYDQGGPQYFPGQTLAPVASQTTQGLNSLTQRAENGSPLIGQANNVAAATLSGQYMQPQGSNPYLDPTFQHAADMLEGQSRSAWGGSDTIPGSGGMQQAALANAQGNLANQIYGGNYDAERQRQQQTAGIIAPTLAGQDYTDINALMGAGDYSRQLGQQDINDQVQRYNYGQNLPYSNLANLAQLLQTANPGPSQTQTATQPYFGGGGGGMMGALGGAAGGAALGSMIMPGIGTVGGGLLGGLLGGLR